MSEFIHNLLQIGQGNVSEAPLWVLFLALAMGASTILGRLPRN